MAVELVETSRARSMAGRSVRGSHRRRRPAAAGSRHSRRRLALFVGVGALAAVAVPQVVHVLVWRTGWRPGLDALRRYHRARRGSELRSAGRPGSSTAAVVHTGRRSGREYVTPVWAHRVGGSFYVGLPYGTDVDWLRNVRAAGCCDIEHDGVRHHAVDPVLVPRTELPGALGRTRRLVALMGIQTFLRVDISTPTRVARRRRPDPTRGPDRTSPVKEEP